MWTQLSTLTKTVIASTIAGGVLISGIVWQGEPAIQSVKNSIDSLQSKLVTAINDNTFLQDQFNGLKNAYQNATSKANGTIQDLKAQRLQLQTQLADLQAQMDSDNTTDANAKQELQNEINRLEGELDKANQQIAELESYAKTKDESTTYTAVNKDNFQFSEVPIDSSRNWTEKTDINTARNYTQANIDIMKNETNILAMEKSYKDMGRNITIVGITTYTYQGNVYLAYIVQPDNSNLNQFTQPINDVIKSMSGTDVMFFLNEQGQLVGSVFEQ